MMHKTDASYVYYGTATLVNAGMLGKSKYIIASYISYIASWIVSFPLTTVPSGMVCEIIIVDLNFFNAKPWIPGGEKSISTAVIH